MRNALANETQIFEAIRQNLNGAGVLQLKMISEALLWIAYDKNNVPKLVVKVSVNHVTFLGRDRDSSLVKGTVASIN